MRLYTKLGLTFSFLFASILPAASQVSIATLGESGAYVQNFDFLGTTDYPLIDNGPLNPGIYAFSPLVAQPGPNTFDAEAGTGTTGEFNNYGTDTDRAMGSVASDTTGSLQYGIRFVNNTGVTVTSIEVR